MQVHALREDFREKNSSTNQHIIRLESLQAEVSLPCLIGGTARGLVDKEPSELGNKTLLYLKSLERHTCEEPNGEHLIHALWVICCLEKSGCSE